MAEQNLRTAERKRFGSFICQNPHCQKNFSGYRGNKNHYCSKRCNKRIHPPLQEKICERCSNAFIMKATTNAGKFCSMECRRNPVKICQYCGRQYYKAAKYYCSKKCEMRAKIKPSLARLLRKVIKTEACWIWTGSKNRQGYGTIWHNGKVQLAHRVSYEITQGKIPQKLLCLHSCDNPACVNPEHLKLGNQKENMRQSIERGRARKGYHGCSLRKKYWDAILAFYGYACAICHRSEPEVTIIQDHYIPLSRGGGRSYDNVWPLCEECNQKKHAKIPDILELPHVKKIAAMFEAN